MTALDVPPGPGFIASVAVASAIHHAEGYDVAQLLITHPGPRRPNETPETVEDGMRRLAESLHLGPGDQPPPFIGARITMRRRLVTLDYGHEQYVMTLPAPSEDWLALVERGELCRVALVAAPLTLDADQAKHDAHVTESLARGLVMWGTTHARRRF
ncbi:hypothetical protein DF268_12865 [Streptomyces sp. V2]|uniref:hypothetical protein n=1 Tax=Streptomyces TaxID=1883 RepID=UPI0006EBB1DD|nr:MULTISPECIES: hypothetical protein [Streptomyces]PWG13261.1 hypothetical protein DF268_12865 [Streptomyces sp. V2]